MCIHIFLLYYTILDLYNAPLKPVQETATVSHVSKSPVTNESFTGVQEYSKQKRVVVFSRLSRLGRIRAQLVSIAKHLPDISLFLPRSLCRVQVDKIAERQPVNIVLVLYDVEHHRQPSAVLSGLAPLISVAYVR